MVTTVTTARNQVISKAPLRLQSSHLTVPASQQPLRADDGEDQLGLVCTGSPLVGRPTELDHRRCASEWGYAESTARLWSGCY